MNMRLIIKCIYYLVGFFCFINSIRSMQKAHKLKEGGNVRDYIQQEFNTLFYVLLTIFTFI